MHIRNVSILCLGMMLAGMLLPGCLQQHDGVLTQRVEVELPQRGNGEAHGGNYISGQGAAQFGTSLAIAVPDGLASTAIFGDISASDNIDQGLVDLDTSSVVLDLPVGQPVQIFEYTFNDIFATIQDIVDSGQIAGPPNVSAAFTITGGEVSVPVSMPITTTAFSESFTNATLDATLWQRMDAGAVSGTGELTITAAGRFDPAGDFVVHRAGDSQRVQSNKNLQLTNQRIAGLFEIRSLSTNDVLPSGTPHSLDRPAQVVGEAELRFRPRPTRGLPNLEGFSAAKIFALARTGQSIGVSLLVFTCSGFDGTCAQPFPTDINIAESFSTTFPSAFTGQIPFALEHLGSGVFKGTFNGQTLIVDYFNHSRASFFTTNPQSVFNENDFLGVQMRARGRHVWQSGDTADIVMAYQNIEVGTADPTPPPGTATKLADSLPLVDDFSASQLNTSIWQSGTLEIVKDIRNGELALAVRGIGGVGILSISNGFSNSSAVNGVKFDARIDSWSGNNSDPLTAQILSFGTYYNTEASGATGDQIGDIHAVVSMRDTIVQYDILRCTAADCSTRAGLAFAQLTSSIPLGTPVTIETAWDGNQTFTFTGAFSGSPATSGAVSTGFPNLRAPVLEEKLIGSEFSASTDSSMTGAVDNVFVNGVIYDDFSAADGRVDKNLWLDGELTREIQNGKFLFRHSGDRPTNIPIRLVGGTSINKVAADFTVVDIDEGGNNSARKTRARISGLWFNEFASPTDCTGDVFAHLQIRNYVVEFFADQRVDSTCSANAVPLNNPSTTTVGLVQPGTTHTLYLAWDTAAKVFTYQLDNQTPVTFDPATDATNRTVPTGTAGAPFMDAKNIETRVNENNRFIEATVDNVRTGP